METKRYKVLIDPIADMKLAAHVEFLARVSENAAFRLYDYYEQALGFLEKSPESCPVYYPQKPLDIQLRYHLFGGRYKIVFEISGNTVFAYDIQDSRQDVDKSLV